MKTRRRFATEIKAKVALEAKRFDAGGGKGEDLDLVDIVDPKHSVFGFELI